MSRRETSSARSSAASGPSAGGGCGNCKPEIQRIIDEFFAGGNSSKVFFLIVLTAGLNLIFAVGIAYCQKYLNSKTNFIDKKFDLDLSISLSETEYQNLENPKMLEQVHLAKESKIRAGSVADFIRSFFSLLAQIGMAIGFVYLFSRVQATLSSIFLQKIPVSSFLFYSG